MSVADSNEPKPDRASSTAAWTPCRLERRHGTDAGNCWTSRFNARPPSRKVPARIRARGDLSPARRAAARVPLLGCIRMKHLEEGALGGPVLAGNPVTDPLVAGVGMSGTWAVTPPGTARADSDVVPAGVIGDA